MRLLFQLPSFPLVGFFDLGVDLALSLFLVVVAAADVAVPYSARVLIYVMA